jgi:hypothetical protein
VFCCGEGEVTYEREVSVDMIEWGPSGISWNGSIYLSLPLSMLEDLAGSSIATLGDLEPSLTCCPLPFFLPLPLLHFEDAFEGDVKSEDLGLLRSPMSVARWPRDESE